MAFINFGGGRSWSPSTGFVTTAGAKHLTQQTNTQKSREYFANNPGGVGSTSSSGRSSGSSSSGRSSSRNSRSSGRSSGGSSGGSSGTSNNFQPINTLPTLQNNDISTIPTPTTTP